MNANQIADAIEKHMPGNPGDRNRYGATIGSDSRGYCLGIELENHTFIPHSDEWMASEVRAAIVGFGCYPVVIQESEEELSCDYWLS